MGKYPIAPVFIFNQNVTYQFLENISRQINQPAREAELKVEEAQILAVPGQVGYSLDIPASIESISRAILNPQDNIIPLSVHEIQPDMLDASQFAITAQSLLSSPLELTLANEEDGTAQSWKFMPQEVAAMLTFERVKTDYQTSFEVKLNENILENVLTSLSTSVNRPVENPKFIFNDQTRQLELLQPGRAGRTLNVARSISAIQSGIQNGSHSIPLECDRIEPAVKNDVRGDQLGIRELIHSEVSYFTVRRRKGFKISKLLPTASTACWLHRVKTFNGPSDG